MFFFPVNFGNESIASRGYFAEIPFFRPFLILNTNQKDKNNDIRIF